MFNTQECNTTVFEYQGSTWQIWNKPYGANIIQITAISGGGGGGGGRSRASDAATGGGGGASSPITTTTYIASMLPDTLYIQVGAGGVAGIPSTSTGNAGGNGSRSYVSIKPNTSVFNLVCVSGAADSGGGTGGVTGPSSVAGGVASSYATQVNAVFMGSSVLSGIPGQNGGTGDDTTIPSNITGLTNSITCPGCGGSGCGGSTSYPGASILQNGLSPTRIGGVVWSPTTNNTFYSLTTDGNPTTNTIDVTASVPSKASDIGVLTYTSISGMSATGWTTGSRIINKSYFQFDVAPTDNNRYSITSIGGIFYYDGPLSIYSRMYYSKNNFQTETAIGSATFVVDDHVFSSVTYSTTISVERGEPFGVRVYGYLSDGVQYPYSVKNFGISGTTGKIHAQNGVTYKKPYSLFSTGGGSGAGYYGATTEIAGNGGHGGIGSGGGGGGGGGTGGKGGNGGNGIVVIQCS